MAIHNRPLCLLALLLVIGTVLLPFLSHAPNRLLSGQPIALWQVGGGAPWFLLPGLALLAGPFLPQRRRIAGLLALVAMLFLAGLVHAAALGADRLAEDAGRAARTSFGAGFWVMALAAVLALTDLVARSGVGPVLRLLAGFAAALPVVAMLATGHLDQLSILKEYANRPDKFHAAILRHLVIVVAALLPTLAIGVPLGVIAARRKRLGTSILSGLNLVQTVPSIAIFGLLIAPLSALATAFPAARALGISGIGLAPAVIALTLYCMLPIVRNTAEGLAQVPASAIDAARGMGMTRRQIFWKVEVPLALPVFLSGLRITVVQAIGLAAVAALIGAGGLGSIMFQGLFSNALDLILLGALPIIALAAVADGLFKLAVELSRRGSA